MYHGNFVLGSKPLSDHLNEIQGFLDTHPNEIVTIIRKCYLSANTIDTSLTHAGLLPFVFAKDTTQPGPRLQQMIDDGQRLLIFNDVDDASPA